MQKELEAAGPVIDSLSSISEIVRTNYKTAPVFKKYKINYCCAGNVTLKDVCSGMGVNEDLVVDELQEATRNISLSNGLQFNEWKTDFLIDYIINVHHAYLYKTLPEISAGLLSFMDQHKKQYPELAEVYATFCKLSELLLSHNRNEEAVIFPYLKRLDAAFSKGETYAQLFVRTLRKPLTNVKQEQTQVACLLKKLQALTNNYKFPEKACTNHQVIYRKLHEFHDDIVQHKHLENNILLPRASEIERLLLLH